MSELRHSPAAVALDLVRAGAGAGVTGLPVLLAEPPLWLGVLLSTVSGLFLTHFLATVQRARRRYLLDDQGLRLMPGGTTIDWRRLDALHLDYFSTRRDGRGGWMQLRLRAGGVRMRVDSSLQGFEALLARAVRAAGERELALSATTTANLAFVTEHAGATPK